MKFFKAWLILVIVPIALLVVIFYNYIKFNEKVTTKLDSIATELAQVEEKLDLADNIAKDIVFDFTKIDREEFCISEVNKIKDSGKSNMTQFTKDGVECFRIDEGCQFCIGEKWCLNNGDNPFETEKDRIRFCQKILDIKQGYFKYKTLGNGLIWSTKIDDLFCRVFKKK